MRGHTTLVIDDENVEESNQDNIHNSDMFSLFIAKQYICI